MRKIFPIFLEAVDWIFFALLIISIYFLIETNYSGLNIIPFLEFGTMIIAFFLLFYYFRKIIWAVEERAKAGPESLTGKEGIVTKELNPEGEVRVEGIIWKAKSKSGERIEQGERIRVMGVENISLIVEKINT